MKRPLLFLILFVLLSGSASATLTDGLVSYFRFDQNYYDTMNIKNATAHGSPTLSTPGVPPLISNASLFGNDNGGLNLTAYSTLGTGNFTANFWINITGAQDYDSVFMFKRGSAPFDYGVVFGQTWGGCSVGPSNFCFYDGTGNGASTSYASYFNKTTMITITKYANHTSVLYINGVATLTQDSDYGFTTANSLNLMFYQIGTERYANGKYDEFGLWNRTLTTSEITSLYNSGSGLSYPFSSLFTVRRYNLINGSPLSGFCANVTNGTTSLSSCNSTGSTIEFDIAGQVNVTAYNSTNYYDNTVTNHSALSALDIYSHQALVNVTASRLFLGTAISTFNTTNNGILNTTSSGSILVPANNGSNNIKVDVAGNFSKNITCTVSTPLTTTQCSATGVHDTYYYFNASDVWNDLPVTNFSLTLSNASLGGTVFTGNTTNGSINISLLRGYTYFTQFSTTDGSYEHINASLNANASQHRYQFDILPTPSIDITLRDATTGAIITENLSITITGDAFGLSTSTTSGGYFLTDIDAGQYTIRASNANYSQSSFTVTAIGGGVYYLSAYLQQNTTDVIMQFIDSVSSSVVLSNTTVAQYVFINDTWQPVSSRVTDVTGRTSFGYLDDRAYRFVAVRSGYETKQFDLDPVLFSTYTIKMQRSTSLGFDYAFQGVYIDYDPQIFYSSRENTLDITFSSPALFLSSYNYSVNYPGGALSGSGTNAVGQSFTVPFNITGATFGSRVNITLTYDTTIGIPRQFNYSHVVVVSPGNSTHIANRDNTYGLGLLERLLIATIIVIVVAGLITMALGPLPGLMVGLLIFGYFVKIGFVEWWAVGISFLVGFALLVARSD